MTIIKSSLQANQLLAGLQQREPKLYDLIRSIIRDLENLDQVTGENQQAINIITGGGTITPGEGLNHLQVMRRISEKI